MPAQSLTVNNATAVGDISELLKCSIFFSISFQTELPEFRHDSDFAMRNLKGELDQARMDATGQDMRTELT